MNSFIFRPPNLEFLTLSSSKLNCSSQMAKTIEFRSFFKSQIPEFRTKIPEKTLIKNNIAVVGRVLPRRRKSWEGRQPLPATPEKVVKSRV